MNKTLRKALSYVPPYAIWIFATIFTVVPVWWMFVVSARSRVELSSPTLLIRSFFIEITPTNHRPVFQYMINCWSSLPETPCWSRPRPAATYALSRYKLAGSDNIFFWTITNRMAPPAAFLLPLFLILRSFQISASEV
jgi:multiple sugar transport system permease protein